MAPVQTKNVDAMSCNHANKETHTQDEGSKAPKRKTADRKNRKAPADKDKLELQGVEESTEDKVAFPPKMQREKAWCYPGQRKRASSSRLCLELGTDWRHHLAPGRWLA